MVSDKYSIVIVNNGESDQLESILTNLLSQSEDTTSDCDDCVVVVNKGKREAEELLDRFRPRYSILRTTFVPETSRRMDALRIALTLGIKAAENNKVIISNTLCPAFTPFRQFACKLQQRKLTRRTGADIRFDIDDKSIVLDKQTFLQRDAFEHNINFLCSCYNPMKRAGNGMWLIRTKYVLAKCHLYQP